MEDEEPKTPEDIVVEFKDILDEMLVKSTRHEYVIMCSAKL